MSQCGEGELSVFICNASLKPFLYASSFVCWVSVSFVFMVVIIPVVVSGLVFVFLNVGFIKAVWLHGCGFCVIIVLLRDW